MTSRTDVIPLLQRPMQFIISLSSPIPPLPRQTPSFPSGTFSPGAPARGRQRKEEFAKNQLLLIDTYDGDVISFAVNAISVI